MSDCCSSSPIEKPKKYSCPINGKEYKTVSIKTIQHQIKQPWHWQAKEQAYFFCDDPTCDVVYFGEDKSIIKKSALRSRIGIKEGKVDSTICYCFDVCNEDYQNNKSIKEYVTEQTKNKTCDCEIRNPSGKCCLKDFPKPSSANSC